MQIVRRFLIAPSLARLIRKDRAAARIAEGYFATQSGRNSHVSLDGGQCQLVLVTTDQHGGPIEERTEVPRAHADALFDVCSGRVIYDRVRLPIGAGHDALVDRFAIPGVLDLVAFEFESADDAMAFFAPPWLGPEVTGDHGYDPRGIALNGLPPAADVPLSNEALDSLLDVLEDRVERVRHGTAPARRSATDSSVIDALRRLASPDHSAEAPPAPAEGDAAADAGAYEHAAARPLSRSNYAARPGEDPDARIDEVIATLSQALGNAGDADGAESGSGMPDAERQVTRLRRLGS